jgi:NADH-quinone oxidoreductase subunit L
LIGTLALAGIWPFAGFWSKDEILANSWLDGLVNNHFWGYIVLGFLVIAAAFTAFYMWRQIEMVFFGQPRTEAADHAPESSAVMVIPLLILGVLSIFGGFLNVPPNAGVFTIFGLFENIFGAEKLTLWLEPSVANAHAVEFQPLIAIGALLLALAAIFLARSIYGAGKAVTQDNRDPLAVRRDTAPIWNFANARMYWDETYYRLFENPFNVLSRFLANTLDWDFWHDYVHNTVIWKGFDAIGQILARGVDLGIIDGIVNGIGALVRWLSGRWRRLQTGYVRTYAVTFLLGVVLVIVILLLPALTNAGK